MFISKNEAWEKVKKTDISIFKKELIFFNLFEYELKTFMETEKNTKLLKILVSELIARNLILDNIKKVIIKKNTIPKIQGLIKIGIVDSYTIYIKVID